jgi:hypothetical protein
MLLALLALGLPMAALASGIDYKTGKFESGTFSGTFTTNISATEVGSMNTITIDTGTLTKISNCGKGFTCYDFKGGSVTVMHGGSTVFTDSLKGGEVRKGDAGAQIIAMLLPDATVAEGQAQATFDWRSGDPHRRHRSEEHHARRDRHEHRFGEHHTLSTGSTEISVNSPTTIPEPGTLGLLGTGLIGLAGVARRKLKLPT